MPSRQARKELAADPGIVTGIEIGERMMAVGIVKADGTLRMLLRDLALAHEEIVGPEHVMRFDGEARIRHMLRHMGTAQTDRLRRSWLSADHVVLGAAAQGDEALCL